MDHEAALLGMWKDDARAYRGLMQRRYVGDYLADKDLPPEIIQKQYSGAILRPPKQNRKRGAKYDGTACPTCGGTERYVSDCRCVRCRLVKGQRRRLSNV